PMNKNENFYKAYREGKLPFPDGTIIAALHYHHVSSEENNKVFGTTTSRLGLIAKANFPSPTAQSLPRSTGTRFHRRKTTKSWPKVFPVLASNRSFPARA